MWVFLSSGLIMPSRAPMDEADPTLTDNGRREIQVRGRLAEHVEAFRDIYVAPFTDDYSDIERTPHMDYNVRMYMTHEEFAAALGRAVMDIDYRKFKPTAEGTNPVTGKKFAYGAKYHSLLNSIWGSVLRLAPAGGVWGPKSAENPDGYSKARGGYFSDLPDGSSFFEEDEDAYQAPLHGLDLATTKGRGRRPSKNLKRG